MGRTDDENQELRPVILSEAARFALRIVPRSRRQSRSPSLRARVSMGRTDDKNQELKPVILSEAARFALRILLRSRRTPCSPVPAPAPPGILSTKLSGPPVRLCQAGSPPLKRQTASSVTNHPPPQIVIPSESDLRLRRSDAVEEPAVIEL